MKTRLLLLSVPLALVAVLAAGCGGGGSSGSVPADSIAKVGGIDITKTTFNEAMNYASLSQGQQPPKVGTPAYAQLKEQAVTFLVRTEELRQEGEKLGVTVSQKDIDGRVALIRKASFQNDEKKLEAALKAHHITLPELEKFYLGPQLLSQKLEAKVTKNVNVSKAAALKYYNQNKPSFSTPAETTRSVRHILVDSKSQAEQLETKLKNGASFTGLAKKYSKDTGSAQNGGKLTAVKGQLVKPFQDVAFSLKTGTISQPVHSQAGWHIIQALGPVKKTAAHTQTFAAVKSQIESNLAGQQQQVAWSAWLAKLPKDFKGKVAFQSGYQPVTTSTPTPTAPATTTG